MGSFFPHVTSIELAFLKPFWDKLQLNLRDHPIPPLNDLAKKLLKLEFHNPSCPNPEAAADVAMKLYMLKRKWWETSLRDTKWPYVTFPPSTWRE